MIEIELFFKIVESEIRRKHIKYLKRQKCLPSDQAEQIGGSDDSTIMVSAADDFIYSDNPNLREKVKRVKSFNKGIDTAINVLHSEYKTFIKRFKSDCNGGF